MRGWLLRTAVRRSIVEIRYVTPVAPAAAPPPVAALYDQVERDFGVLAPPVVLHSPEPDALAACWAMLRETLVATGRVDRGVKEAVAAAVSVANRCPYCVEVHGTTLDALAGGPDATAVARDRVDLVTDPEMRRMATWARHSGARESSDRPAPPFGPAQAPEVIGVAVTFHYINRMVNIFLDDSPLPTAAPVAVRSALRRLLRTVMRHTGRTARAAGAARGQLPAAALPPDLGWARGSAPVADAFARAGAAIEAAGARALAPQVRDRVVAEVSRWDGRPLGPSRSWTRAAVADLPAAQRPVARLALLAALASYQVDASVIDDARGAGLDDRGLIAATSWASLTAARRIGAWMWAGTGPATGSGTPGQPAER
ncbi:carboxymuconolactone decarboxylase family protein [Micromonospora sp. NPDC047738]|uniref:carboxymuconolactone decarboxylase family protein n=1 Tax=unclassified Micromonospora TaxID=2617518 RepID=UPI0033DA5DF6